MEFFEVLYLRRHLLVRHQHDVVDDEVVMVPSRFLGLSLREVGLSDGPDYGSPSVRLTASQHRRRQRERSEALRNRRQGGGDRGSSTPTVRRVRAEASAPASAGSSGSPPVSSDPPPASTQGDFGRFMPELVGELDSPVLVSSSTMTEVIDRRVTGSQTSSSLMDFPSVTQRRTLAGLVVEHPTAGVEEIVRMFIVARRPFSDVELQLIRLTVGSCMMSVSCLAQRIRVDVSCHCARPETVAASLRGTWHQLGEYVDRNQL